MAVHTNEVVNKVTSLYKNLGWKRFFARARFWYAPYIEVEHLVPASGKIVDLGCGEGILTNYLGLASKNRQVLGIEIDKKRIRDSNRGVNNVEFRLGDITKTNIPQCDGIVIFQVLHHLRSHELQEEVIKHCTSSLKRGGKLIIVEIYVGFSLAYFLTWIADHLLVAWFFEKKIYTQILFRRLEDWTRIIKKNDLTYNVIHPNSKFKPFSNAILECTKK